MNTKSAKPICSEFNDQGICEIDVDKVAKKWDGWWLLTQCEDHFWLVKTYNKFRFNHGKNFRIRISADQARELIERIGLHEEVNSNFKFVSIWHSKEAGSTWSIEARIKK